MPCPRTSSPRSCRAPNSSRGLSNWPKPMVSRLWVQTVSSSNGTPVSNSRAQAQTQAGSISPANAPWAISHQPRIWNNW